MVEDEELRPALESEVEIPAGAAHIVGSFHVPEHVQGAVLFAHGTGSSRHSPRNRFVAQSLQRARLATLLLDLLTPAEEAEDWQTGELRFNISLLAERLLAAIRWLEHQPQTRLQRIGCFGASTGEAAALVAAARRPQSVAAVVSRGGRPDLAGLEVLRRVQAPTLLIVGGRDFPVTEMNATAFAELRCVKRLEMVPDATHLFEEPGALEEVARLARNWFKQYLGWSDTTRAA